MAEAGQCPVHNAQCTMSSEKSKEVCLSEAAHKDDHGVLPPLILLAGLAPLLAGFELLVEFGESLYEAPWARTMLIVPAAACIALGGFLIWRSIASGWGKWGAWLATGLRIGIAASVAIIAAIFIGHPGRAATMAALDGVLAIAAVMLVGSLVLAATGARERG